MVVRGPYQNLIFDTSKVVLVVAVVVVVVVVVGGLVVVTQGLLKQHTCNAFLHTKFPPGVDGPAEVTN